MASKKGFINFEITFIPHLPYHLHIAPLILVAISLTSCSNSTDTAITIDYNRHVRPILSDKCFSCHGPDANKREAGLRLDLPETAYAELEESPGLRAIVPGKPNKSELVARIHHEDPEERMPPADSKLALTDEERQILTKWIEEGAQYKPHWALIPPERLEPPAIQHDQRIQNDIDRFVLTRLANAGLHLSEPASKETLIRRASFDLRGLPPSIEEIDAFVNDDSPDAFERVVDAFLDSPAYGERMATFWMDVARYADSDGYLDDKHRDFSPWRDWVIRAFNDNLPYDDFVTWQLAGDLLPDATQDQILATAFNRLHKKNSEAGIVFEEFRAEYVADRTNTFGKAFLGLTLECARCHDHKYDPVSQRDYYQLYSFFNSTDEIGHAVYGPDQTPGPALLLTSTEDDQRLDSLKQALNKLSKDLDLTQERAEPAFKDWLEGPRRIEEIQRHIEAAEVAHYAFDAVSETKGSTITADRLNADRPATLKEPLFAEGIAGQSLVVTDYNHAALGERVGWYDRTDPFSIDLWIYPDTTYADAMLFTHSEEWRLGLRGYTLHLENNQIVFRMAHSYPQNAIQVTAEPIVPVREWTRITMTYDGSSKAAGVHLFYDGRPVASTIQRDNLYKGILFTPDIHTYGFKGIELGQRDKFTPFKNGRIDEFRVFDRTMTPIEVLAMHDLKEAKTTFTAPSEAGEIRDYFFAHHHPASRKLESQIKTTRDSLNAALNRIPEIMVMGDLPAPRSTHVLTRGMYDAPAEEVQPGAPEAILAFPENLPQNRLGLAKWLFHPDNPLPARVMVNRIWKMHFGRGLVTTSDDFGNQGATPSHPALLDWLAADFRDSGWDLKHLHRRIMLSAVYQQSSKASPELLERDPDNEWLARGGSFRLPAEMIRDNALTVSGLLSSRIGGPSVYPYQPEGLWDELSTKGWRYRYLQEPGEGLYRRSLYTIWKRTSPPPSMLIFDAPDRSVCTVDRQPTSTPLQALVLLNDPQYIEAARVLAENLLQTYNNTDSILAVAFRTITGRRPTPDENAVLASFYESEKAVFSDDPERAAAYLNTGEHTSNHTFDPVQTAALAVVINGLMNTDEGVMRR